MLRRWNVISGFREKHACGSIYFNYYRFSFDFCTMQLRLLFSYFMLNILVLVGLRCTDVYDGVLRLENAN